MSHHGRSVTGLLIISGIDLLLAALCAGVGVMVLLMGSVPSSTESRASRNAAFDAWWIAILQGPADSMPDVICNGASVKPVRNGERVTVVVRGRELAAGMCRLSFAALDHFPRSSSGFIEASFDTNMRVATEDGSLVSSSARTESGDPLFVYADSSPRNVAIPSLGRPEGDETELGDW